MEFRRFNSLENTYQQKLIDKVFYEGKNTGTWIATEKVHGANFSFWCDGEQVLPASRSQFVDGTFFNCQSVINKHSEDILKYHKKHLEPGDVLVIYGELYGSNIQKEVFYGNERRFAGFEVVVNGVIHDKARAIAEMKGGMGIDHAPLLHVGTFEECMAISEEFRSRLTPEDFDGENTAEGVVIEPVVPTYLNNGSRIYFKNKSTAFREKKEKSHKTKQSFEGFAPDVQEVFDELMAYATETRVRNVISKVGMITNKQFPMVAGLFVKDMMEDYEKDTEVDLKVVAGDVWKQFVGIVNREAITIARPVILEFVE